MFAHVDADAFFASVLVRCDPTLNGKPLIAAGMGGGCVIAASYEAKAYGIKTGMPISEARRLIPGTVIIRHTDFAQAHTASRHIESILRNHCCDIEMTSIDEWYLDLRGVMGGVPKDLPAWALGVQAEIKARTALGVSFGIAPTKLLAKMASPYRKPFGIAIVHGDHTTPHDGGRSDHAVVIDRITFLRNLAATDIPGIGYRRTPHVQSLGLTSALDIATADPDTIRRLFGRPGMEMQTELNGTSVHPLMAEHTPPQSVSRCRSFPKTRSLPFIQSQILTHLSYMVFKMRRHGLGCTFVGVWLRDDRYIHHHRDVKASHLCTTEEELLPYVQSLLKRLERDVTCCTQAGLVLSGLKSTTSVQCSLFEDTQDVERREGLQKTLDTLRTHFGRDVVRRGTAITTKKLTRTMLVQD